MSYKLKSVVAFFKLYTKLSFNLTFTTVLLFNEPVG